jgi:hypothetical protein
MTRVTLSPPVEVGMTEVRVIERLRITIPGAAGCGLASKEPMVVLIRAAGVTRAVDPAGDEIPMRRLRLQYPQLSELDDA